MQPCTIGKYSKELHYYSRLRGFPFLFCGTDARYITKDEATKRSWPPRVHRLNHASLRQSRRDLPVDQVDGHSRRQHQTASGGSAWRSMDVTTRSHVAAPPAWWTSVPPASPLLPFFVSPIAMMPLDILVHYRRPDAIDNPNHKAFSRIVVGIVLRQISQRDS